MGGRRRGRGRGRGRTGTWERKRGETRGAGAAGCWLLQTHPRGPRLGWVVPRLTVVGGAQSRNRVGSGLAGYRTKPSLFHPSPCWAANGFWNVGRLQNTQHPSGLSLVVASSVPDCDQQQISSSNIPGNQLDQSGHQPRVPLRLHLWRWGRLCATMGSWGGTRLHLARPFLFSLLFLSSALGSTSSKHGVAGAEGGRICLGLGFVREQKQGPAHSQGGRTVDTGPRCNGQRPVFAVARK